MKRDEDSTVIDESVCLKRDERVVLPEQERFIVETEGEKGGKEYRSVSVPLEFYASRRYIDAEQYRAGRRLHMLWRNSVLNARYCTMRFTDTSGTFDAESMALIPQEYMQAVDAVVGFHRRRITKLVCLWEVPAGEGKPMELLREGLDQLAAHFRSEKKGLQNRAEMQL